MSKTVFSRGSSRPASNPLAGWDISLAALALACMTAGFWRLWPGAVDLDSPPIGPVIIKAGLAALGFVAIASRWETALVGLARNPLPLVLLALACVSSFWAVMPSEALQQSILMIVVWCFGIGLALRFRIQDLAEICGFAGVFGLILQIAAQQGVPPADHFDGDLAFALIGSLWAANAIASRRLIWLIAAGLCAAVALAAGDWASLGAAGGFAIGCGLAAFGEVLAKRGAVSILLTAWVLVAGIIAATVLIMFGAGPISNQVSQFLTSLGPHMVLGQGFGAGGPSVAGAMAGGLGILGLGVCGLVLGASLCQIVFGGGRATAGGYGHAGALVGCIGAWLVAPTEVAALGPMTIVFAAMSFAISLASAPKPMPRASVLKSPPRMPAYRRADLDADVRSIQRNRPATQTQPNAAKVADFGLRPRI